MTKKYFVSFCWESDDESGFGNDVIDCEPISTLDDITEIAKVLAIEKALAGPFGSDFRVGILHWQEFEKETEHEYIEEEEIEEEEMIKRGVGL